MTVLGFDHMKEMYKGDLYFKEAYEACADPIIRDRIRWMKYMIQDILLFKSSQLCNAG